MTPAQNQRISYLMSALVKEHAAMSSVVAEVIWSPKTAGSDTSRHGHRQVSRVLNSSSRHTSWLSSQLDSGLHAADLKKFNGHSVVRDQQNGRRRNGATEGQTPESYRPTESLKNTVHNHLYCPIDGATSTGLATCIK